MLLIRGFETPPGEALGAAVAIGNFDGVHRGHQVLIQKTRELARQNGCLAGAIVFEPHPREFFTPEEPHFRLTPLSEKQRLFALYGLDLTIVLDFNARLARLSANQFIKDVLRDYLAVSHVVVGYDFSFGQGRTGTAETLEKAGRDYGFGVKIIPAQRAQGTPNRNKKSVPDNFMENPKATEVFSSSNIRKHLRNGNVRAAACAMAHWWRVTGSVIKGAKVGTGMGHPTANIALPPGTALAHGIYAVRVIIGQKHYNGAAYFGTRPSLDDGAPLLEVTIFDFSGDLYTKEISIDFIDYVRPDKSFSSLDLLKKQIDEDCKNVRELLARAGETPPECA